MGLALGLATVGGARAADVQFTITSTNGVQIATFELNSKSGVGAQGVFVIFQSIPVTFWSKGFGGGFTDGVFSFFGPQFYSGSESSPTFLPGSYQVSHSKQLNTILTL